MGTITWLSMDTAPKDGTPVVLLSPHGIRSAEWKVYPNTAEWRYDDYNTDGCGCCGNDNEPPTGWLPMSTFE